MFRSAPRLVCATGMILLALGYWHRAMHAQEFEEYQVKAALLTKIPLFIDWPKKLPLGDDKVFFIGILGPSPFGVHLKRLEMEMVKHKKIVVRRFNTVDDYEPCHMLFISGIASNNEGAEQRLVKALAKTKGRPVLLVTDQEGLAAKGAVLNLYIEGTNVKIEMNRDAEKRVGLTTNAQLLSLIEKHGRFVRDAK